MAIEENKIENEVIIDVSDVYKSFRVYFDKSSMLKERFVNPGRSYYENRDILKGISFKVHRGETVALIGHNGCGKSTTLKMITKILYPNKGSVTVKGKVSSLIELGAGFHPDMSGRENIYINGSVLGLSRDEVDKRIDDIIRFSELEEFIDNPIRTYSSGMYMRLAFSVAINVDADILLIDEILAVGDQSFQEKCIKRLDELRKSGVTVVLVSHSMGQVQDIADRCIWIDDGRIVEDGTTEVVCEHYSQAMEQVRLQRDIEEERQRQEDINRPQTESVETTEVEKDEEVSFIKESNKQPIDLRKLLSEKMQGEGTSGKGLAIIFAVLMLILASAVQDIYQMGTGSNDLPTEFLSMKMQLSGFLLLSLGRVSIPMILMYIGFIRMPEWGDFSREGLAIYYIRHVIPLFVGWEFCVIFYRIFLWGVYGVRIQFMSIIRQMLLIDVVNIGHAWFARIVFIGILLLPFIWKIMTSLKFEIMRIVLVLLWIFLFLFNGFDLYGQANGASQSIPTPIRTLCYLLYIGMGYYLSLYKRRLIRGSKELLIVACGFLLTVFSGVFFYQRGVQYIIWYTFFSVSVMAFLLFDIIVRFRLPEKVQQITDELAKCSILVFAIFRPIQMILMLQIGKYPGKFLVRTIALWIISAVLSYAIAWCIYKICAALKVRIGEMAGARPCYVLSKVVILIVPVVVSAILASLLTTYKVESYDNGAIEELPRYSMKYFSASEPETWDYDCLEGVYDSEGEFAWLQPYSEIKLQSYELSKGVYFAFEFPEQLENADNNIKIIVNKKLALEYVPHVGENEVYISDTFYKKTGNSSYDIEIYSNSFFNPAKEGTSDDDRDLAIRIRYLGAQ